MRAPQARLLLPGDLERTRLLGAELRRSVAGDAFAVALLSEAPDAAAADALALLPDAPRLVAALDARHANFTRPPLFWRRVAAAAVPRAGAVLLFLGEEAELLPLLVLLREASFWSTRAAVAIEAPSTDGMEFLLAYFDVRHALGLEWDGRSYARAALRAGVGVAGPGVGVLMLECAPELRGAAPGPFRPDDADQLLGRLLVQRVARLRGARCFSGYAKGMGRRLPNGSFTGHLVDIVAGRVLLITFSTLIMKAPVLQYLYPHVQDDYCLEVRKADQIPFLEGALGIFSPVTWITFGVCFLTFVMWEVVTAVASRPISCIVSNAFFDTLRTAVTGSFNAPSLPGDEGGGGGALSAAAVRARRRAGVRLLLSVASVVATNAFGGSLTSHLSRARYAPELDTLAAVDAAVRHVHIFPAYTSHFAALDEDDVAKRLARKFVHTLPYPNASEVVREALVRGEPRALMSPRWFFRKFSQLPAYSRAGRSLLHQAEQCALAPAYKALAVVKGSPLERPLNSLVQRALQAGLYVKFERDALANVHVKRNSSARRVGAPPPPYRPYRLALRHLGGAFCALGWALLAAAAAFAAELLCAPPRSRRRQRLNAKRRIRGTGQ